MKGKSDIAVFGRMLGELGKLTPIMLLAILFGLCGYLAATAIATISATAAVSLFGQSIVLPISSAILIIVLSAVLRGLLRYTEQLSSHYIAFKILAILRDKVFAKLRKLAPAKLDTHEKGNLISVITSDIEMMEVFYAHTIAPIMIAAIASVIYTVLLWRIHFAFGLLAAVLYLLIGVLLPVILKRSASASAANYRQQRGQNSSFILDSMYGLKEILQFSAGSARKNAMNDASINLGQSMQKVKKREGIGLAVTDMLIVLSMLGCLGLGYALHTSGVIDPGWLVVAVVLLASSFGPVLALSALSTTLAGTLASAHRVFDILDESPAVQDVQGEGTVRSNDVRYENVSFSYPARTTQVLQNINIDVATNTHIAIVGNSGSGKSTMLKLLMRFYDTSDGLIHIDGQHIHKIPTQSLHNTQTMVSQDTFLFSDTIENNIRMENKMASLQDVISAAKKAAIHDAIEKLPQGYQTNAGELGERFSSGEKQRISLARAFLTGSRMLLLDEPTSNLDILSEAEILKSIQTHCANQTVVLVSHHSSTTAICERVVQIEKGCMANAK